jgi:hypothetical protein
MYGRFDFARSGTRFSILGVWIWIPRVAHEDIVIIEDDVVKCEVCVELY